jgi:hypothetical protein
MKNILDMTIPQELIQIARGNGACRDALDWLKNRRTFRGLLMERDWWNWAATNRLVPLALSRADLSRADLSRALGIPQKIKDKFRCAEIAEGKGAKA